MIRFYQKFLSPLKHTRCPYTPTCSQYGLEAIQKYGAFKGSLLACWRILRCNPFSKGAFMLPKYVEDMLEEEEGRKK